MTVVSIEIPDEVLRDFELYAWRTGRTVNELMVETLQEYLAQHIARIDQPQARESVLDHQPHNVGPILNSWTSRAEMLEDFFDRDPPED